MIRSPLQIQLITDSEQWFSSWTSPSVLLLQTFVCLVVHSDPLSAEGVAISILSPPPFFCLLSFCFRSDFFFLLAGEGSIYPEPVAFYFPLSIPGILLSAHCSILPLEGNGVKGRVPPGTGQHGRSLASPMLSQGSRHGYIQSPASSSFTLQLCAPV